MSEDIPRAVRSIELPRPKTMTVGQLRAALADIPADYNAAEVIVRVADEDIGGAIGGLVTIGIDEGCTETAALMLDADAEAEKTFEKYPSLLDANDPNIDFDDLDDGPCAHLINGDRRELCDRLFDNEGRIVS